MAEVGQEENDDGEMLTVLQQLFSPLSLEWTRRPLSWQAATGINIQVLLLEFLSPPFSLHTWSVD